MAIQTVPYPFADRIVAARPAERKHPDEEDALMFRESTVRSLAKTASWRLTASVATAAIVWLLTRRWSLALTVGGFEAVVKTLLYYAHERVWDRWTLGREVDRPRRS